MMKEERRYTDARDWAIACHLGRPSARPEAWDIQKRDISRDAVYNSYPAFPVNLTAQVSPEVQRDADRLFDTFAAALAGRKIREKRVYWHRLFHTALRAAQANGCIRVSRNLSTEKRIHVQVVDAAVGAGLFLEHRSPPGSPKMSRLLSLAPIEKHVKLDPWRFDRTAEKQFVFLRERETGNDFQVDWSLPIAAETQSRLELINEVNSRWRIIYEPFDQWQDEHSGFRQLRPVHYAVFTERWNWHGRLYTGKYGQQQLRKIERETIQFDGESSVELDYSGMHPRLLYHLAEMQFDGDPYALWGKRTTGPMRLMAKQIINAAINAESRDAAISASNREMRTTADNGERKIGKALEVARLLKRAADETGLKFADIYDLAAQRHPEIAKFFGSDFGMVLMRIDSSIALDILYHFAKRGCPCLSVHDSFIVPVSHAQELKRVMHEFYQLRTGFLPIVKPDPLSLPFSDFQG